MAKKVGRLILVRHGESIWNSCDPARGMTTRFTGWCNIPLSDRGKEQAKAAARALVQFNLHTFDSVYMSVLERTTMTYDLIREEIFKMQKKYADGPAKFFKDPTINQSWRLNERHYGALVGLSKEEAEHSMGREPVMGWRRSWDQRPPPMTRHPYFQSLGTDTKPRFDWQTGMFASFLVLIVYCLIHLHLHSPFLFHLFMSSSSDIWTKAINVTIEPGKEPVRTLHVDNLSILIISHPHCTTVPLYHIPHFTLMTDTND